MKPQQNRLFSNNECSINAMKFKALSCIIYLHRQIEYKVTLFIDSIY